MRMCWVGVVIIQLYDVGGDGIGVWNDRIVEKEWGGFGREKVKVWIMVWKSWSKCG